MNDVTIWAALAGGLVSFFSPCVVVLVPAFLAHISGVSLSEGDKINRWQVLVNTLFFVLGFTIVFVALGASLGWISSVFQNADIWIERIGGILIIFFGLIILGVIKIPWLQGEHRLNVRVEKGKTFQTLSSLIVGIVFAIGWTPCISPILAAILVLASNTGSVVSGAWLLLIYSVGMMIPFIIAGIFLSGFARSIGRHAKALKIINVIAGVVLIFFGIILVLGYFSIIMSYLFNF